MSTDSNSVNENDNYLKEMLEHIEDIKAKVDLYSVLVDKKVLTKLT